MAEHEKIPAQGGEMPPGERAASTGGRGIDTVLGAEPAGNAAQKRNITAALTDDEREKLIDLVDRLIRNPDAVTAKDCIIGNDVRTVQWIAEHTRALLTSPRAAVPGQGWKLVPEIPTVEMLDAALPGDDTFGRGFKTRIYQEMLDAAPAAPAAPVEDVAPNVVEAIAEQWDGCMYAAPGIDIDIGEAIRQAATRFAAKQKRRPFASSAQSVAADAEARFIAEHGHALAKLLHVDAFDIADRDAQIMEAIQRAAVSPATAESKCTRCGASTAQACNERGCFYLESGEGEPATADERHEDGLLTTEALISIIERHFDHDHPDGQRLVEMAQDVAASQHKQGKPATADERAALSGECFIVIGYGESDIPEAKIVERREDLLDAVLGMIYTHASEAPDDVRAEYAESLSDDDEWAADQWSVDFEIGGIVIWRAGLHPVTLRASQATAPARIEALRKGLFNARDALRSIYENRVTSNATIRLWIEDANRVLNGEQAAAPAEARESSVVASGLIGLARHVRAVPAYSKLVGDMDIVDQAIAILNGAPAEAREPHSDDIAVDAFAAAMKAKMAASRAKGRGGWETCTPSDLSRMLREHVEKGDPRDVANFCMMLHHHGASISGAADAGEAVASPAPTWIDADMVWLADDGESFYASIDDAVQYSVDQDWPDKEPRELKLRLGMQIPTATVRIFDITENGHEWEVVDRANQGAQGGKGGEA
ncbi:hypothetical protein [Burkholderia gladioli]|uniref:hypothetical protein n=1 Tax=Burkholderia gladioli TaxID=28095 RepID=UPI0023642C01|nr:hypothetical protein [Burkholderia gladioli]MDD1789052.1 hypothetical protein [Burkholderia gladioli]